MTLKEEKAIQGIYDIAKEMRYGNHEFKQKVMESVEEIKTKVNKEYLPIQFEKSIVDNIAQSLQEVIKTQLGNYNSPLVGIINLVVQKHSDHISQVFEAQLKNALDSTDFKSSLEQELKKKIAKNIVAGVHKSVDSITDKMKRNVEFEAKLTLIVAKLVEEYEQKLLTNDKE